MLASFAILVLCGMGNLVLEVTFFLSYRLFALTGTFGLKPMQILLQFSDKGNICGNWSLPNWRLLPPAKASLAQALLTVPPRRHYRAPLCTPWYSWRPAKSSGNLGTRHVGLQNPESAGIGWYWVVYGGTSQ